MSHGDSLVLVDPELLDLLSAFPQLSLSLDELPQIRRDGDEMGSDQPAGRGPPSAQRPARATGQHDQHCADAKTQCQGFKTQCYEQQRAAERRRIGHHCQQAAVPAPKDAPESAAHPTRSGYLHSRWSRRIPQLLSHFAPRDWPSAAGPAGSRSGADVPRAVAGTVPMSGRHRPRGRAPRARAHSARR